MDEYASFSHTKWECKYHIVFIPKCCGKVLYKSLRQHLGQVFHSLAQQRESQILKGHLMHDHVHLLISIPPKHAVSQGVGFIKGKSAIHAARATHGQSLTLTAQMSTATSGLASGSISFYDGMTLLGTALLSSNRPV